MDQTLTKILQSASDNPEYQAIANYLMSRRAMPNIQYGGKPEVFGTFTPPSLFNQQYRNGNLTINPNAAFVPPQEVAPVMQHEMTHAAYNQLFYQADALRKSKQPKTEAEQRFLDTFDKITKGVPDQLKAIDATYQEKNKGYRANTDESLAFALQNASNPAYKEGWNAPTHVDPTLATQLMILLDQAQNLQNKKPQSQGR